jgi:hypothetical protein
MFSVPTSMKKSPQPINDNRINTFEYPSHASICIAIEHPQRKKQGRKRSDKVDVEKPQNTAPAEKETQEDHIAAKSTSIAEKSIEVDSPEAKAVSAVTSDNEPENAMEFQSTEHSVPTTVANTLESNEQEDPTELPCTTQSVPTTAPDETNEEVNAIHYLSCIKPLICYQYYL